MEINMMKGYLKNGCYIVFINRIVVRLTILNVLIHFKKIFKSIVYSNIKIIKIKSNENTLVAPKGDRLLYRKIDGQLLIFDDKLKYVYRKYTNLNQFALLKQGYPALERFYKINQLQFIDSCITQEKLIKGQSLRKVEVSKQNDIFYKIINAYGDVLTKNKFEHSVPRISSHAFFQKLPETNYPKEMVDYIMSEKDNTERLFESLMWTWSHSDLTPDNIMFTEKEYYIVDAEWCEVMPVFYDIANLIYTLSLMSGNTEPLNSYFRGDCDFLLRNIFSKPEIDVLDRKILITVMIALKAILPWDAKIKQDDKELMIKRWSTIKHYIIE